MKSRVSLHRKMMKVFCNQLFGKENFGEIILRRRILQNYSFTSNKSDCSAPIKPAKEAKESRKLLDTRCGAIEEKLQMDPLHEQIMKGVQGLSSNVVKYGTKPVQSGVALDGVYKNPEYFAYDRMSYYEAHIELAKYRLEQPSASSIQKGPEKCAK